MLKSASKTLNLRWLPPSFLSPTTCNLSSSQIPLFLLFSGIQVLHIFLFLSLQKKSAAPMTGLIVHRCVCLCIPWMHLCPNDLVVCFAYISSFLNVVCVQNAFFFKLSLGTDENQHLLSYFFCLFFVSLMNDDDSLLRRRRTYNRNEVQLIEVKWCAMEWRGRRQCLRRILRSMTWPFWLVKVNRAEDRDGACAAPAPAVLLLGTSMHAHAPNSNTSAGDEISCLEVFPFICTISLGHHSGWF